MEVSMEVHGGPWRSVVVSMRVRGGSIDLHGDLHGPPWRSWWRSVEVSMELHGGLHGASMELHEPPWTSMSFHGVPDNRIARLCAI